MRFDWIASASILVPLITLLIRKPRFTGNGWIWFLLLYNTVCQALMFYLALNWINNYFIIHLLYPVQILALTGYYITMLSATRKKVTTIILMTSLVFSIFHLLVFVELKAFDPVNSTLTSALYTLCGVVGNIEMFHSKNYYIEKTPGFWINNAFMIYGASQLILNGLSGMLFQTDMDLYGQMQNIHNFFNIVFYLMITYGLWIAPTKQQS